MQEVVKDITSRVGPLYTLRYRSPTLPEFGEKYIPLEIEVTAQKVSGRDESGYYAPPSAGQGGRIKKHGVVGHPCSRYPRRACAALFRSGSYALRNAFTFSEALAASGA